jgi:DeoR/GlpR family transcriptional regulator of sugar metabolism
VTERRREQSPAERRELILTLLRERGSVTIGALEEEFGISPITARRDLTLLARAGRIRRAHGGAVLPELAAHEDSFRHRLEQDADAKRRLAHAAAASALPGETILVDSSSTAYHVARALVERDRPLTLVTNSLPVMSLAAAGSSVELVGLGGAFRPLTRSFVGPETLRTLRGVTADRVFFSVKGITPHGHLTDPDALETEVKRAMLAGARTVVLLAGAGKFADRGLRVIAPASRVDVAYLVDPPAAGAALLAGAGVEVRRA